MTEGNSRECKGFTSQDFGRLYESDKGTTWDQVQFNYLHCLGGRHLESMSLDSMTAINSGEWDGWPSVANVYLSLVEESL